MVVFIIVVVVVIVAGVLLRLWILGHQSVNADEATPGLIAHEILHGRPYALYWGQNYGGGEPFIVAALFAVLGQSAFTLNVTPAILAAAAAVVVWRIGLRLFSKWAAIAAASLTWIWGEATLWNSVREFGFRGLTLLCGLLVILFALRIHGDLLKGRSYLPDWIVIGLFAGVGWWSSPEIVYFVIPAAFLLVTDIYKRRLPGTAVAVAAGFLALIVGALPWIYTTATRGGTLQQPNAPISSDYLQRFKVLFTHAAPIVLGVRVEGAGNWIGSHWLGVLVLGLITVATAGSFFLFIRDEAVRILLVFLAIFPFIYAAFSPTSFWNDACYVGYLPPMLALLLMGALWRVAGRFAPWCGASVLILALLSTLISFNDGYGGLNSTSALTFWSSNPNGAVVALAGRLEAEHVSTVLAEYWLANNLSFISNGRVLARDPESSQNPPMTPQQMRSANKTWIFVNPADLAAGETALGPALSDSGTWSPGGMTLAQVQSWASNHGVSMTLSEEGPFQVLRFDRGVALSEVAPS